MLSNYNGFENGDILCNSTSVTVIDGKPFLCSNTFNWDSTAKFASPGTVPQTFTLYFPKTYVSVNEIWIKDGYDLRFLSSILIDSSLDGVNYKRIMKTNVPFCNQKSSEYVCQTETVRKYVFPKETVLKYLRITGSGQDSCGTMELSFVSIELLGYFTSFCISINKNVYYSFPFFIFQQIFVIFE